jgi:leucyl aminopeptidase
MLIEFKNKKLVDIKADAQIVLVGKKDTTHAFVKENEKELKDLGFFDERVEHIFLSSQRKLFIKCDDFDLDELRSACAKALGLLKNYNFKILKMASYAQNCYNDALSAQAEGFWLGAYTFEKYKSKKNKNSVDAIFIGSDNYFDSKAKADEKSINDEITVSKLVCETVNFTRDTVNLAPDDATPSFMAQTAEDIAKANRLECHVYDEIYLTKNKMGAFMAVARASYHPPRLVHLSYKPKNPKAKVVFVGKGLTYDSGGLSLKPADYMVTMKADKSGAAAVLGIMRIISKLGLNIEVHGVIGACENMIGGNAYKPDDILVAKNGKTIEVRNTDAEGRLVLADCLCYIQDYFKDKKSEFDYIIDFATLTGSCVVALGEYTTGAMGHNECLKDELIECATHAGELMAKLPFNKHLQKLIKSEIADMSNCSSSRYGGAITAAMFLDEFIYEENKQKWAHLDIAGPAYVEKAWGYNPHGASGTPIRTVAAWLRNLDKKAEVACSEIKKPMSKCGVKKSK